ncbi:MAG: hypothetical protein WBA51_04065 [Erythrobacter sp.]
MAEQQFWMAAAFAFAGWFVALVIAIFRSGRLGSGLSKGLCWIVPVLGFILIAAAIYEGLYGESGGYRGFALGFMSLILWVLAVALPIAQLLFAWLAKAVDPREG